MCYHVGGIMHISYLRYMQLQRAIVIYIITICHIWATNNRPGTCVTLC